MHSGKGTTSECLLVVLFCLLRELCCISFGCCQGEYPKQGLRLSDFVLVGGEKEVSGE